MSIIEKILNEAAILSESRRVEWKPIRPGNHERDARQFLDSLGINIAQNGTGMLRFYNYLKAADGGFLASMIDELDFRQRPGGQPPMLIIEFSKEFLQSEIKELTTRNEKISHVMGAIIMALKQRQWLKQDFDIEALPTDVHRFQVYEKGDTKVIQNDIK